MNVKGKFLDSPDAKLLTAKVAKVAEGIMMAASG
jgi:hypothetical protein